MIQDAVYTSPNGQEATFAWEIGKRKTKLKTGVYEFPGRDGAHAQHQGAGARTYPLVCIFSGEGYMEKADAFETMLTEKGIAELQHPIYGTIKVIPIGDIEREDDPVNKDNESTVTITFVEIEPGEAAKTKLTEVSAQAIEEKLEEFTEAAVADFAAAIANATVTEDIDTQIEVVAALEAQTQTIIESLEPIAMTDADSYADFLTSANELKYNIENLYENPATLFGKGENIIDKAGSIASRAAALAAKVEKAVINALNIGRLTIRLMQLPANIAVSIAEKIKGYSTLAANLIQQYKKDPFGIEKIKAAYATASLALTGACAAIVSGSALTIAEVAAMTGATSTGISKGGNASAGKSASKTSSVQSAAGTGTAAGGSRGGGSTPAAAGGTSKGAGVASRAEAIEASSQAVSFFENVTLFQDTKIAQNAFVDAMPASHLALSELVYASAQLILNASFSLPLQKTITLDRDRQVIELCAELYGTTDYLDNFIIENNLSADEIVILPMGKKVSYYA